MSIAEARRSTFTFEPAEREELVPGEPILSVILDCYYGLDLVKQSIQSVLDQDYPNVELILVDNGAQPDVAEHLRLVHSTTANVPMIRFAENQFAWDDVTRSVAVCWNAALLHARGAYVCHLAYDDTLSPNYATRMVRLFTENSNCVTAAPLPVSIDEFGRRNESFNRAMVDGNRRGRYTPGTALAFELIQGNPNKLFAAPGEIFVIRKSELLLHGGFDRLCDCSQVLKYAILGDSGFDSEATLYWRHHPGQVNKIAVERGLGWFRMWEQSWEGTGLVDLWKERFSEERVNALVSYKNKLTDGIPVGAVAGKVRRFEIKAAIATLRYIHVHYPAVFPRAVGVAARELPFAASRATYAAMARAAQRILPRAMIGQLRARRARRRALNPG